MHRMVGTVFKFIGISIIVMLLMDVSLYVIDRVTVNNRINSAMKVIEDELARNNCIPDDIAPMLDNSLKSIVAKSNTAVDIKWNLNTSEQSKGVTYQPINAANVKQNGEMAYLVVKVKFRVKSIMFDMDGQGEEGIKSKFKEGFATVVNEYVSPVPMLRYLK